MKLISLAGLPSEGVSHNPEIRKRVILQRGDVPHLNSFSQTQLKPGQVARAHAHTGMHEVFYVLKGSGHIRIDDGEHSLTAGTCVAVAPGESHEIANTGAEDLTLIYFGIEE
ncbi:MAG TPA: cupin domain-containing protein [Pyrinomonadaceae bacterium]|jgi:mannose-6-phosphate isomerase-like protein (cupin superfamily)|nr:cupin domain-containing protein [Pyrinomonadaceae bacterium]